MTNVQTDTLCVRYFYLKNVINNWCDKDHIIYNILLSLSLFLHASIDLYNQIHITMFKVYVVFLVICTGYLSVKYFSVCLGHFECVCVYGHAHL